ncbi:MAG: tetratricopeptide repeat protein [Pirellulales bacterium]|nr:tetratricopeptide repeat protein [Pirellulales bacterium]
MSPVVRSSVAALLLVFAAAGGRAWAENEGQEDLDRATEAKVIANSLQDLGDVIRLLDSALEKGLDESNTKFAENLLGSTLIQRGLQIGEAIFQGTPVEQWPGLRRLALADLEKGVKLTPERAEAFYLIARLNALPGGDAERAAEAIDRAVVLCRDDARLRAKALTLRAGIAKDPEKRLVDLEEAVRLAPDDAAALRTRGLVYADLGKLDEAIADLDKAAELDPKHVGTYEAKALVLSRAKKFDEALIALDKAQELKPNALGPLVNKAQIHVQQANFEAALHVLNQAYSRDAENIGVLLLRAGVYEQMKKFDEALADVDRVLSLKPDLPAAMRVRAMLLAGAERLDEAVAQLEGLRKIHPEDATTLLQLGMLYNAQKEFPQAVEAYSAVLKQQPDLWVALRGRGDSWLNSGKHEEAIADYNQALKHKPQDPGILNNLAWVLATSPEDKLREGKRAIELATAACDVTDYKEAHILSTLAAAYAEMGDFKTAIKWSERGLEVAEKEQIEPLTKELESYRAGKPWRELLSEGEPAP